MAAQLRIDQATPGVGVAGRSRHDLIAGEVITLVATSPAPGAGITFTWEIIDKRGSAAALSATTGTTVTIGPALGVVQPCSFLIELKVNDNGNITKERRIASVRTATAQLRLAVFPETAPEAATLNLNDPANSTDNALYINRSGVGATEQNPFGWSEWAYELVLAVEAAAGGGAPLTYLPSGIWICPPTVVVGDCVYATGAADTCDKADNSGIATALGTFGIVVQKPTATTAIVALFGEVSIFPPATFVAGTTYYLGTAGALTTTPPLVTGTVVRRIGTAKNDTTLSLDIDEPIIN